MLCLQQVASYIDPLTRSRTASDAAIRNSEVEMRDTCGRSNHTDVDSVGNAHGVVSTDPDARDLAPILDIKVRSGEITEEEYHRILRVVRRASVAVLSDPALSSTTQDNFADSTFEDVELATTADLGGPA
jgi:hypothetical protein